MDEPTNQELLAQISNCALSSAFNESEYGKPSKSSVDKLAALRSSRKTFCGVDDFIIRAEVDRYIKEHTI